MCDVNFALEVCVFVWKFYHTVLTAFWNNNRCEVFASELFGPFILTEEEMQSIIPASGTQPLL